MVAIDGERWQSTKGLFKYLTSIYIYLLKGNETAFNWFRAYLEFIFNLNGFYLILSFFCMACFMP